MKYTFLKKFSSLQPSLEKEGYSQEQINMCMQQFLDGYVKGMEHGRNYESVNLLSKSHGINETINYLTKEFHLTQDEAKELYRRYHFL